MTLSLADLKAKFQTVTLPITLVCAGNRRKEQNVVQKGLGFNVRAFFAMCLACLPLTICLCHRPVGRRRGFHRPVYRYPFV